MKRTLKKDLQEYDHSCIVLNLISNMHFLDYQKICRIVNNNQN